MKILRSALLARAGADGDQVIMPPVGYGAAWFARDWAASTSTFPVGFTDFASMLMCAGTITQHCWYGSLTAPIGLPIAGSPAVIGTVGYTNFKLLAWNGEAYLYLPVKQLALRRHYMQTYLNLPRIGPDVNPLLTPDTMNHQKLEYVLISLDSSITPRSSTSGCVMLEGPTPLPWVPWAGAVYPGGGMGIAQSG
jgi:hypothetical protein